MSRLVYFLSVLQAAHVIRMCETCPLISSYEPRLFKQAVVWNAECVSLLVSFSDNTKQMNGFEQVLLLLLLLFYVHGKQLGHVGTVSSPNQSYPW